MQKQLLSAMALAGRVTVPAAAANMAAKARLVRDRRMALTYAEPDLIANDRAHTTFIAGITRDCERWKKSGGRAVRRLPPLPRTTAKSGVTEE